MSALKVFSVLVALLSLVQLGYQNTTRARSILTDNSGKITNSGYPNGYTQSDEHTWQLENPLATSYTIYFDDVDLSIDCSDYLSIMDVKDYAAPLISVCDERPPLVMDTTEVNIYFRVTTLSAGNRGRGFSIRYEANGPDIDAATSTTTTTTTAAAAATTTTSTSTKAPSTETSKSTITTKQATLVTSALTDPGTSAQTSTIEYPQGNFPQGTQDDSNCGAPAISPVVDGLDYVAQGEALESGTSYEAPTARVVNGEEAVPHSWPWQVSIQGSYGSAYCGGTLVQSRWVVTAAHCAELVFIGVYGGDVVLLGAHDKRVSEPTQQQITIVAKYIHPQYDNPDRANDVALLQLKEDAVISEAISLACEAHSGWSFPAGTQCVVTGWGVTKEGGNVGTNILQQGVVSLMSDEDCYDLYQQAGLDTTSDMQCAGGLGQGACNGDSGGPLNCYVNGRWYHMGIVSFGEANCDVDIQSIYARVASHRDFIDSTIAENS